MPFCEFLPQKLDLTHVIMDRNSLWRIDNIVYFGKLWGLPEKINKKRKKRLKKVINFGFTLKILERGDLLLILKIPYLHIFLPTSVNDDLGLMCLKNKPNFKYKLHPNIKAVRQQSVSQRTSISVQESF